MRMKFGITWWGKKWLETMNNIDYSTRLPRGRAYANKGYVESIDIKNGKIYARVEGSRRSPYKIELQLSDFSSKEKETILNIISENPLVLSKMLAGELPKELNEVFMENNIKLFPEKWGEVFGECSCPDWAVPCKHIAAVIYMMSCEIDKNPFIIFELHGFSIQKELKNIGYNINQENIYCIKKLKNTLVKEFEMKDSEKLKNFDFSKIPYLRENIFSLLSKNPLFYPKKDYKNILEGIYIKTEIYLNNYIEKDNIFEGNLNYLFDFSIYMFENLISKFFLLKQGDEEKILSKDNLRELTDNLENISYENIDNYSEKIKIVYNIYHFSLILLKKGAFVPEMICIEDNQYRIRWIPALFNNDIKDIFEDLVKNMNCNVFDLILENKNSIKLKKLTYLEKESKVLESIIENEEDIGFGIILDSYNVLLKNIITKKKQMEYPFNEIFEIKEEYGDPFLSTGNFEKLKKIYPEVKNNIKIIEKKLIKKELFNEKHLKKYLPPKEQLFELINIFITNFIREISKYESLDDNYKINSMFFLDEIFEIEGFKDKEIPNTINLWLNKLHLSSKDYTIILKIDDIEKGFDISILIEKDNKELKEPLSFEKIMAVNSNKEIRLEVLKDLNIFIEYFTELEKVVNSKGKENLFIEYENFETVLFKIIPVLKSLGIKILLPKSLENIIIPKTSMIMSKSKDKNLTSYFHLNEMLSFDWKVALGDDLISIDEFKEMIKGTKGLVKLKDKFIYINEKDMEKLLKNIENPKLSIGEILKAGLEEKIGDTKIEISDEAKSLIRSLLHSEKINIPNQLNAKLREYQHRGYEWLYKNYKVGFGSLMADDMGLGKTIQIITLLLKLKSEKGEKFKGAFIVVPTTLITNWEKEINKFASSLSVSVYHGLNRVINNDSDIVITSYGTVRRDIEILDKKKWEILVLDEAQNIKNPSTSQTKAIKKLKAVSKVALTGTPVENKLLEYWSIFDFINKGYLGNVKSFKKDYAIPIEVMRDKEKLESFRKTTSPFIIRRMKNDKKIIKDLPEKIEMNKYCNLSGEQLGIYQNVVNKTMDIIKNVKGIERKGIVFKLMTSLKQICNHPSHYLKKENIDLEFSGKTKLLVEILEKIYETNEKVLIFTQYREMGDLLVKLIQNKFNNEVLFLHGGVQRKKRDEYVERFQNDKFLKTMILSLKAGGTGLNLTASSNVIHFDLWWNPAVETQATDRAYRIGQDKNVMVYRLITKGTFEEKINEMIMKKKELADLTVSNGEKWIGEFSDNELIDLFEIKKS